MNPELIYQLAHQRVAELCQEAMSCQSATTADRERRARVKERAGWALIKAGLKLTDPPGSRQHARPRPAGL